VVKLSKGHVKWVLENLLIMKCGELPQGSRGDGTPSSIGGRTAKTSATFTDVAEDVGEVERRLNMCGKDGLIPILWYTCAMTREYIALNLGITKKEVKDRGKKAMNYITQEWPPTRSYEETKP